MSLKGQRRRILTSRHVPRLLPPSRVVADNLAPVARYATRSDPNRVEMTVTIHRARSLAVLRLPNIHRRVDSEAPEVRVRRVAADVHLPADQVVLLVHRRG